MGHQSYDDRRMIRIEVLDQDDNDPMFIGINPPYELSVYEAISNVVVGNVSLASDPDSGNNSIICYYIVGKNEDATNMFFK